MPKFKVCKDGKYRDCKTFDSLEDIIKWANEEISENKKIKVGDIVTIREFGQMYTTLGVTYFEELWNNTAIDSEEIYKIMIHYDYGLSYGVGYNPDEVADRIKYKVVYIYNDRVFIERQDYPDNGKILCVHKRGLEKLEEV